MKGKSAVIECTDELTQEAVDAVLKKQSFKVDKYTVKP